MQCLNIDIWKILRSYKNLLEKNMTNNSTSTFLKQKWYVLLRYLLTTVQCHLANMRLWKSKCNKITPSVLYTLGVKPNTSVRMFCATKSKRKEIKSGSMLWYSITKRQGHSIINKQSKKIFNKIFYNIIRLFIPHWKTFV